MLKGMTNGVPGLNCDVFKISFSWFALGFGSTESSFVLVL